MGSDTPLLERRPDHHDERLQPRVLVKGDGPPLIYFHGESGLEWDGFLDGLAERFTVYAPEHPGTTPGNPDGIHAVDSFLDLILYYDDTLGGLGLSAPVVVGHSFGGMVAAEYASFFPDKVSRLVLIAPQGLWLDEAPVTQFLTLEPDELAEVTFHDPAGPLAQELLALPEDETSRHDLILERTWSLGCTAKFAWPFASHGLERRLHRVTASTLLLWGAADGIVPPVYADEFARLIPDATTRLLDGAGHLPHLEQPEETLRAVQSFVGADGS